MSRPVSEKRAIVTQLAAEGLTQKEIGARLGISRQLVSYYLGPQGLVPESPQDERSPSPPSPTTPEGNNGAPRGSDVTLDTLKRLLEERDTAASPSDRIRASEAILRNLGALRGESDWNPPRATWLAFLRALLATLPPSDYEMVLGQPGQDEGAS